MIKKINSHTNPLVQHIVQLHHAKYRTEKKEFIAQGIRTVSTLIAAGHTPLHVCVTEDTLHEAEKIVAHEHITLVAPSVMQKISTAETPSGVVATFAIPEQPSYDNLSSGIVLVEVQDPGNAGTLLRTAVAMGKKTAVFVDSVSPWNPKTVQASAGAVGMISLFCISWEELLEHKGALPLCALIPPKGNNPRNPDLRNALLVIGNEGNGLSRARIGQCEEKLSLAMPGGFESLNAAIAGSIALYITTISPK